MGKYRIWKRDNTTRLQSRVLWYKICASGVTKAALQYWKHVKIKCMCLPYHIKYTQVHSYSSFLFNIQSSFGLNIQQERYAFKTRCQSTLGKYLTQKWGNDTRFLSFLLTKATLQYWKQVMNKCSHFATSHQAHNDNQHEKYTKQF